MAKTPSFVPRESDDGAITVAAGGVNGVAIDLDGSVRSEAQLVNKYREMVSHPEVDNAVDDIVNEAIIQDPDIDTITLNLDKTDFSENIKKTIRNEFAYIQRLLNFNIDSYDIFRRWYIDGRLYYHIVIDPKDPKAGIQELRYIDPRKIRKIREIKKTRPEPVNNLSTVSYENEYYLFNPKGFAKSAGNFSTVGGGTEGIKIAKDSVLYIPSGLLDKSHTTVISHLHKAIKALNNLRSLEDSVVIYRISRAPERRIFYIDVGNLPKMKAEQYVNDIMTKFKNRVVYDANTGEIRDDRKFMTMLEDFWLPRREGGRGTEISTLPAGQNLGEMTDVEYFLKQLYKALNVPVGRLESNSTFNLGRGAEISRDEDKFAKFVNRLQLRFGFLFLDALGKQLILKNILSVEEWDQEVQNIRIRYEKDAYYSEMREIEILNTRIETLREMEDPTVNLVTKYFSTRYIQKKVLRFTEDEIKEIQDQQLEDVNTNANSNLANQMADLDVKSKVYDAASKKGVVLDPGSGNIMPPEMMPADPTIMKDEPPPSKPAPKKK